MNHRSKKKIKSFLFLIVLILLIGLIVKLKDKGIIQNKENSAQVSFGKK